MPLYRPAYGTGGASLPAYFCPALGQYPNGTAVSFPFANQVYLFYFAAIHFKVLAFKG